MLMRCWSVGLKFIIRSPVSQLGGTTCFTANVTPRSQLGGNQCHPLVSQLAHNQCYNQIEVAQLVGLPACIKLCYPGHNQVTRITTRGGPKHKTLRELRMLSTLYFLVAMMARIGRSVLMFTKGCVCVDSISNVNSQLQFQNIKCLTNLSKFYFFLQFCQS